VIVVIVCVKFSKYRQRGFGLRIKKGHVLRFDYECEIGSSKGSSWWREHKGKSQLIESK